MRCSAAFGGLLLLLGGSALPAGAAGPEESSPVYSVSGAYTYRTYCASCHGEKGEGDGPLAASLRFHPPDLSFTNAFTLPVGQDILSTERFYGNQVHLSEGRCFQVFRKY